VLGQSRPRRGDGNPRWGCRPNQRTGSKIHTGSREREKATPGGSRCPAGHPFRDWISKWFPAHLLRDLAGVPTLRMGRRANPVPGARQSSRGGSAPRVVRSRSRQVDPPSVPWFQPRTNPAPGGSWRLSFRQLPGRSANLPRASGEGSLLSADVRSHCKRVKWPFETLGGRRPERGAIRNGLRRLGNRPRSKRFPRMQPVDPSDPQLWPKTDVALAR
jgi:hypothetical protein